MSPRPLLLAAALAALAANARTAEACSLPSPDARVYWSTTHPSSSDMNRCQVDPYAPGGYACHLSGYLYKPDAGTFGSTNLPAMVFVHGSGATQSQNSVCNQVNYWVDHGYVVFTPYMRGVTDSTYAPTLTSDFFDPTDPNKGGFANTGVYIVDWADAQGGDISLNTLEYMQQEGSADVEAALQYVANLNGGALVNPNKIALAGHSYGGVTVALMADLSLPVMPAAILDYSGAALSWSGSMWWQFFIGIAAFNHRMPMYFQQNTMETPDGSYDPAVVPFTQANANPAGGGVEMHIFSRFVVPQANLDACANVGYPLYHCAHIYFVVSGAEVPRWVAKAHDFLVHYGVQ